MTTEEEMTAARARLAAVLRRLRRAADLTGEQLADRLERSQSWVSRVETGKAPPRPDDVSAWLEATGATPEDADEVDTLLDAALTSSSPWKKELEAGRQRKQERIRRLEAAVSTIRVFSPDVTPGLLQIPSMTAHVFGMGAPVSDQDLAEAVAERMHRQVVLYDRSKTVEFVLTEAALWWRPGSIADQLAQLDRLSALTSSVTIGVIPRLARVSAHHYHGFEILGEPSKDDEVMVLVETVTRELCLRDPSDVSAYLDEFEKLRSDAVFGDEARVVIRRVAVDLASQ